MCSYLLGQQHWREGQVSHAKPTTPQNRDRHFRKKNTERRIQPWHSELHTTPSTSTTEFWLQLSYFLRSSEALGGHHCVRPPLCQPNLLLPSSFYTPPSAFLLLSLLLLPFLPKVKFRATYCFALAFWTLKWSASDQTHSQRCEQASKTQTSKSQTTRKRSCFPNRSSLRADSGWLHRIRVGPAHICKILFIISRNCFKKQQLFL